MKKIDKQKDRMFFFSAEGGGGGGLMEGCLTLNWKWPFKPGISHPVTVYLHRANQS